MIILIDNLKKYERSNKKAQCITRQMTDNEKKKYQIIDEGKEMKQELKIDNELRDLLPPLTEEEYNILEENIKANGCIDPIVIWNGYIVDGHNRYSICTKHNIEFKVTEFPFKSREDVIQWMVETQLGRRNLSPIQRIQIAEKYRPTFIKKADENKKSAIEQARKENPNNKDEQFLPKSAATVTPINTRDELSRIAKVGHDTYSKGKKILELEEQVNKGEIILDDKKKEVIEKVKKDEVKINTAFNDLFGKPKSEDKQKNDQIEQKKKETISIVVDDGIKDIIKDIKTPKFITEEFNFKNELERIVENIKYSIQSANDDLFEINNIDNQITHEEKTFALNSFQVLIENLNQLKEKINKTNIKEIL